VKKAAVVVKDAVPCVTKATVGKIRVYAKGCDNCGRTESFQFRSVRGERVLICCNACSCYANKHPKKLPDFSLNTRGEFAQFNTERPNLDLPKKSRKKYVYLNGQYRSSLFEKNQAFLKLYSKR